MTSETKKNNKNTFVSICIVEAVCVSVILLTALIVKLFFKETHTSARRWCKDNLFEETEITADFDRGLPT